MRSNIRPFKRPESNPQFMERLLAGAFYMGVGVLLYYQGLSLNRSIILFALMGAVYFFLVKRDIIKMPYFVRYHYLQSLVLFLFLTLTLMFTIHLFIFAQSAMELAGLRSATESAFQMLDIGLALTVKFGPVFVGLWQGLIPLMGHTHRIPHVTPHVIYWV